MEQGTKKPRSLKKNIEIMREHLKVIQVNMEVLEVLKLKGAIALTDKRFIEIVNLDKKHRRMFEQFVLDAVPDYLGSEASATDKVLLKKYQLWSSDLIISLGHLDRVTKEFIQDLINQDKRLKKHVKEIEVKDKRFWRFLDKVKSKSKIFESFTEEPEDIKAVDN